MATTITKTVVFAPVGPAELDSGRAYVHEAALDGDEDLHVGKRVEVCDEAGRMWAATVTDHDGDRWQLTIAR